MVENAWIRAFDYPNRFTWCIVPSFDRPYLFCYFLILLVWMKVLVFGIGYYDRLFSLVSVCFSFLFGCFFVAHSLELINFKPRLVIFIGIATWKGIVQQLLGTGSNSHQWLNIGSTTLADVTSKECHHPINEIACWEVICQQTSSSWAKFLACDSTRRKFTSSALYVGDFRKEDNNKVLG